MDTKTIVEVHVGGMSYTGFKRVSVQYSAKKAVRAFAFTVTDGNDWEAKWNFMPGEEVSILESEEPILKGFINNMTPSYDATNHTVEITGRSKGQDTVDSSATKKPGEWKKKKLDEIAKDLDEQGVGFNVKTDMPTLEYFRVNTGESVFEAVERMTRRHGLLLIGAPDGSIDIDKGGEESENEPLIEGDNILSASATFDDSNKQSEYIVKGQRVFGSNRKALQIVERSKDKSVKRNRPKVMQPETDIDEAGAKKRANWHRDRQSGESISASVRVQGWRDRNGKLWKVNKLVSIYSPKLKLDMQLLLESVNLTQDDSGSFAVLTLVHPKALGSKANTGSKTDPVWQNDNTSSDLPDDPDRGIRSF